MKKLHIGQIGPLNLPIPPRKYGGTERIIYWLCEELSKRGHKVFLFAAKDSHTSAKLIPIIEKSLWTIRVKEAAPYYSYEMAVVAREAKRLKLDIIHDHLGPESLSLYGFVKAPIIHTLHVQLNKDRAWAYKKLNAKLVSISRNQRSVAPYLNFQHTIYNGIDTNFFSPVVHPSKDYLFFAGELAKRKGVWEAIQVAKKLRKKLVIAGRIPSPAQKKDYEFFQARIRPELNKSNIRYAGEVSHNDLRRLYQNAYVTLFPIKWEEPFGLVMVESMACGTPVVAFRRGSVPEVISNGKSGYIVKTVDGMVAHVKKIDHIDRKVTRKHVMDNFSKERMVDEYEKLYYELCQKQL